MDFKLNSVMDYGHVFQRAGEIVWRCKPLLALGVVIAACGGQNPAAQFNINFDLMRRPDEFNGGPLLRLLELLNRPVLWAPVVCGAFVLGLVFIGIASLAEGALIGGVHQAQGGSRVSLNDALQVGRLRFWPVFIVRLLVGVAFVVPLLLVLIPIVIYFARLIFSTGAPLQDILAVFGVFIACLLPLVCVLLLLNVLLSWLETLSLRAIVVEEVGALAGLRRAAQVVRQNFVHVLLVWLILLLAQSVVGGVLGAPLGLLGGAAMLPLLINWVDTGQVTAPALALALFGAGVGWVVGTLLGGAILTYTSSLWTVAYGQFTRPARAPAEPASPRL